MRGWPNDHQVGVYLSNGADLFLVATARTDDDLPTLFHGLANRWEDSASLPGMMADDESADMFPRGDSF